MWVNNHKRLVCLFIYQMRGWKQRWGFFVYLGVYPKSLFKCPPCSSNPPYSCLRCDCFNAQKCGCCNYHLHKQDSSFIDMLPLIRQELGSETMAEATRGSPAPGTRDRPASSVNADDQQKRPVIHRTRAFLINFHSVLLRVACVVMLTPRSAHECSFLLSPGCQKVSGAGSLSRSSIFYHAGLRRLCPLSWPVKCMCWKICMCQRSVRKFSQTCVIAC